jgi:hypothetical protein
MACSMAGLGMPPASGTRRHKDVLRIARSLLVIVNMGFWSNFSLDPMEAALTFPEGGCICRKLHQVQKTSCKPPVIPYLSGPKFFLSFHYHG